MADTSKLSVGKALEKLRGTDEPKSSMTRLDEKIDDLDKENAAAASNETQPWAGQKRRSR